MAGLGLFVLTGTFSACGAGSGGGGGASSSGSEGGGGPLPSMEFSAGASSNAPESSGPVSLNVALSAISSDTVTVDYSVTGGNATGGGTDYTFASGSLTFDPGELNQSIDLAIVDDTLDEIDETIEITLSNPVNASLGANGVHILTLLDDDAAPSVAFDATTSSGAESVNPAQLAVSLSSASGRAISVDYEVTAGSASGSGTDYTLSAGTLTFLAGETSKNVSITIAEDGLDEDDETIEVTLSNPSNSALGTNAAHTYTIQDNDASPTVAFDSATSSSVESTSSVNLVVNLSAPSAKAIEVDYAVTGGTATDGGTDYATLAAGTLSFAAGEISKNITLSGIADDRVVETAGETVEITLSNPVNASLGATPVRTHTIEDDPIAAGLAWLNATQSTNSTNLNQATAYPLRWDVGAFDSSTFDHSTVVTPEKLKVLVAGHYFVAVTVPMTSTVQRAGVGAEVRVNGVAVSGAVGQSGYIRSGSGHNESSLHVSALLPSLSVNDEIEVYVQATAAAGAVTIDSQASLYAEHVNGSRTVFSATATRTVNSTNLNQATAYALEWVETVKTIGYTHSDSVNPESVQLDAAGDYLVHVNIPTNGTTTRGNIRALIQLDGVTVPGGIGAQGMIRNTGGHNEASVHWSGLVRVASAGSILTIKTEQEAANGTITVAAGQAASVFVERVDTTSRVLASRASALVGGTNWNPNTRDSVQWGTDDVVDSAVYTHSTSVDSHQMIVNQRGDYLLVYNDVLTSTVQRASPKVTVSVAGAVEAGAETKCHYIRSSGGHNESSGSLVFLLRDLRAGDIITIDVQKEAGTGTVNDTDDALLVLWKKS